MQTAKLASPCNSTVLDPNNSSVICSRQDALRRSLELLLLRPDISSHCMPARDHIVRRLETPDHLPSSTTFIHQVSMQDTPTRRNSISIGLQSARERLRRLRHDLTINFRKADKDINLSIPLTVSDSIARSSKASQAPRSPIYTNTSCSSVSSTSSLNPDMDGSAEKVRRTERVSRSKPGVAAIFVHAGAGYHSTTNEHIHLGACSEYVHSLPNPSVAASAFALD